MEALESRIVPLAQRAGGRRDAMGGEGGRREPRSGTPAALN